jgi:hypothetical protein
VPRLVGAGQRRGEGRRSGSSAHLCSGWAARAPNSEQRSGYARVCVRDDVRRRVVALATGADGDLSARRRGSPTPCAVGRRECYLVRDMDAASPTSWPAHPLATGELARRSVLGRLLGAGPVHDVTSRALGGLDLDDDRAGGPDHARSVAGLSEGTASDPDRGVSFATAAAVAWGMRGARESREDVRYSVLAAGAGTSTLAVRTNDPATRTVEAVRRFVSSRACGGEHAGDGYGGCLKSLPTRGEMPRAAGWP